MSKTVKQIFLEQMKEDAEFFVKNYKEIIRRTLDDFVNEFKSISSLV